MLSFLIVISASQLRSLRFRALDVQEVQEAELLLAAGPAATFSHEYIRIGAGASPNRFFDTLDYST